MKEATKRPSVQAIVMSDSYWGADGRCIHCGAGNDAHHSYTCPTNLHPDRRDQNADLEPARKGA